MKLIVEIDQNRNILDEWDSYLVIHAEDTGYKATMPYMLIPADFDEKVLEEVLRKLNA